MPQRFPSPRTSLWRLALLAGLLPILAPAVAAAQEDEDRLYVAGQAVAGEVVYETYCGSCHGPELRGGTGPALVGNAFLESWGFGPATRSLSDLFFVESTLMPPGRVRELTPEQHLNVMAYMLQRNGYQPGDVPLTADGERLSAVARQYVAVVSGRPSPFWVNEHPGAPTVFVFSLP